MEEWINNTSQSLVMQNFDIIKEFSKNHELAVLNKLLAVFIQQFIEISVTNTLGAHEEEFVTKEQRYSYVTENFNNLKQLLQAHIGDAFTKSMNEFSLQELEYYCQIKLVPEQKSLLSN